MSSGTESSPSDPASILRPALLESSIGDGAFRGDQASELQFLLDSIPNLIQTSLPDGYFDFFHQNRLTYVGRPLEDLQGWKWTAFIHPEDVQGIVEKWRASRPDVTLMDLRMPEMSGFDAIIAIRDEFSGARSMVLMTYAGDARAYLRS